MSAEQYKNISNILIMLMRRQPDGMLAFCTVDTMEGGGRKMTKTCRFSRGG